MGVAMPGAVEIQKLQKLAPGSIFNPGLGPGLEYGVVMAEKDSSGKGRPKGGTVKSAPAKPGARAKSAEARHRRKRPRPRKLSGKKA